MKLISKYSLAPAAIFLSLVISSCSSYERISDAQDSGSRQIKQESGSRETTTPPETDQTTSGVKTNGAGRENEINYSSDSGVNVKAEAICGSYFKSGDFTYQLTIFPGEPEARGVLKMVFSQRDQGYSNSRTGIHEFNLPYEEGADFYSLKDVNDNSDGSEYPVLLNKDGSITLQNSTNSAGDYYACKGNLIMPEAFTRPLNETDLIGLDKEDMQLLRNEFYAVHGRIFKDENLKTYFETEPWYKGTIESDQFQDSTFTGLEKRNIALLKTAEENFDEKKALAVKEAYDALLPAPYLELLPKQGEINVTLYSDFEHTRDRGAYYEAEGTISVPVTITAEQKRAVESGDRVELVVDELTGARSTLIKSGNPDYGDYEILDTPNSREGGGNYVMAAYDADTGLYRLWRDSDDTVFKRVYEGSVYVLKGACEEYYYYFDMPEKERGESAGSFRVMDFNEVNPYGPSPYSGNILITDPKGYVKALYFRGD